MSNKKYTAIIFNGTTAGVFSAKFENSTEAWEGLGMNEAGWLVDKKMAKKLVKELQREFNL